MNVLLIITLLLAIYWLNVFVCAVINAVNATRKPKNFVDLLKLTFLPYLIWKLKEVKC